MAGLGLTNALRGYQQGKDWRENQDAMAEQKRQRDQINEANKAAAGVVDSTRAQYLLDGGDPDKFRPDENTILKGLDARTNVLAKNGMWDQVVENEAKATGLRTGLRNKAIDQAMLDYQQTQDPISLAQAVYPHVYDGKEIKFAKKLEGGDIEFSLSDGKKTTVKPEMIPEMVQRMRMDPAAVAKLEFQSRMRNLEAQFKGEQDRATVKERGKEDRATEDVRQNNRVSLADMNNTTRKEIAKLGADTRLSLGSARGGGGGGGQSNSVQSTGVDADGYKTITFRDGRTVRATIDGQPVRANEWARRVDATTKMLSGSLEGVGKSTAELRQMSESQLAGNKAQAQPAGKPKFLGFE